MNHKKKDIDKVNSIINNCKKCRLHLTRTNALCGEGNLHARVMLIAQAPGDNEDREGKMFIGPSGKVLDELLIEAGVRRDHLYMTNLIKCRLPEYRNPKQDEIDACCSFLENEIKLVDPEVIVPLGYYATRYFFKRDSLSISMPTSRADFYNLYGRLFLYQNKKVYPLPHPASLLYNMSFRPMTLDKYKKLRVLLQPCKWFFVCPLKRFCDMGKLDQYWINFYCKGDWGSCIRYKMEERGEYHPDWMLPDGTFEETLHELNK